VADIAWPGLVYATPLRWHQARFGLNPAMETGIVRRDRNGKAINTTTQ